MSVTRRVLKVRLSRTGEGSSSRVPDYEALRAQRQNSTYVQPPAPPLKVVLPERSKTA